MNHLKTHAWTQLLESSLLLSIRLVSKRVQVYQRQLPHEHECVECQHRGPGHKDLGTERSWLPQPQCTQTLGSQRRRKLGLT